MSAVEFNRLRSLVLSQVRSGAGDYIYPVQLYPQRSQSIAIALSSIQLKLDSIHHKSNKLGQLQFEWWKQQLTSALKVSRLQSIGPRSALRSG